MQKSEGSCLCKSIRYGIAGAPRFSVICHCASCRKSSAAPTVAWLTFDRAQIEILSGQPQEYRSSSGVIRRFCRDCGSQLFYENAATPSTIDVTTASLDDPEAFPPTMEVWLGHKLSWQTVDRSLVQYSNGSSQ